MAHDAADEDLDRLHEEWSRTDSVPPEPIDDDVEVVTSTPNVNICTPTPICMGYTSKNMRCCTKVSTGERYCKRHAKKTINDSVTCGICYETIFHETKLPCDHAFCTNCIYRWSNKGESCPMCRRTMLFICHSRDVKIQRAMDLIVLADRARNLCWKYGMAADVMNETVEFLLQNEWMDSFDREYKQIVLTYVDYSIEYFKKDFKIKSKFEKWRRVAENI